MTFRETWPLWLLTWLLVLLAAIVGPNTVRDLDAEACSAAVKRCSERTEISRMQHEACQAVRRTCEVNR